VQDGVKLSGPEADLSEEEYKKLFTRVVTEGSEIGFHYPAVKDMTPEQLVDHMEHLRQCSIHIRVSSQAAKITLEQKKIHLSKEEREALRQRDLAYKPKKPTVEGATPRKARARGTAKTEDAIEMMMNLYGWTREKAEAKMKKLESIGAEEGETK